MKSFRGESGRLWTYDEMTPIGDRGGMGFVFGGSDEAEGRVAVKRVALGGHTEADERLRQREIDIADDLIEGRDNGSSVNYLLLPLDRGMDGDDLLIVLPRAEESLNAAMKRGAVDASNALDVIQQVVQGLVELAGLSILHRDLKPANVLWHEGRWKLADFGLARNASEPTGTYTFIGAGTAPYMAPEIWQMKQATVKSDLYALGVMAYELLVGRRPFDGPSPENYREQHMYDDAGVPPSLEAPHQRVLLRLLRKDPNERYQDARSVLEALDRVDPVLEPDQRALVDAALAADKRRSAVDSEERTRQREIDDAEAKIIQARADLEETLQEARDRAAAALPEVMLQNDGLQWHFGVERAQLTIQPFNSARAMDSHPGDPLIMAWAVYSSKYGDRSVIANIVCEERPGGLTFFLLRFIARSIVGNNYDLGPLGHPHGFPESIFIQQRPLMIQSPVQIWQMSLDPLNAAALVGLLAEEIDFPDPP
jgi:serine/threonine protein kinase